VAFYKERGEDVHKVNQFLMEQTMRGVTLDHADLSNRFLQFKMYEDAKK